MHALILGANGMLGRALTKVFEGDEVTAWDRLQLDITDEAAVAERIALLEPDLVVNAAAFTDVEEAERSNDDADAVNGYAVGNVAVACAEQEIPLLHVSTDYVFDGKKSAGYEESDEPVNPVNAYGRSKLLGESLLKDAGKDYWLVRTAWLYGPGGKHFVDKILETAERQTKLRVVDDQHGNPTYAHDVAAAIRELVRDRAEFGIYHLVNDGVATRADVAEAVLALAGKRAAVERIASSALPQTAARPSWSVLRNTKRPPLRPWREGLAAYLTLRLGRTDE